MCLYSSMQSFMEKYQYLGLILTNTYNSISALIFAKSGRRKINLHLRNQLIKPNLWGKGVISFYHMNSLLFKKQYAKFLEIILILGVDFDQYFRSEYSIKNQYSHRNNGQNQPLK